jgi:uncharacterized membrane protein YciS (DUF1049 family)
VVQTAPYLALAFGYVLTFVTSTGVGLLFSAGGLVDALVSAFFFTLVYWLLATFQIRNLRKTKQRLDEQGQFRAYIRHPEGALKPTWRIAGRVWCRKMEPGHSQLPCSPAALAA